MVRICVSSTLPPVNPVPTSLAMLNPKVTAPIKIIPAPTSTALLMDINFAPVIGAKVSSLAPIATPKNKETPVRIISSFSIMGYHLLMEN